MLVAEVGELFLTNITKSHQCFPVYIFLVLEDSDPFVGHDPSFVPMKSNRGVLNSVIIDLSEKPFLFVAGRDNPAIQRIPISG